MRKPNARFRVLMEHYNEVAEAERRALAQKIQDDFYAESAVAKAEEGKPANAEELFDLEAIFAAVKSNPLFEE